jgi:glycosyltransferase involved in cell wall biosynthesis
MTRSRDHEFISVVMPVYNALPHLDGAIRSILDQTHRDFELVVYDDASSDGSTERLREWAARDSRIRLFEGERNLGPVGSSAFVVEHSTAPLVARMDADDLCHRERLARQVGLLRENPHAGLVGTLFEIIDGRGRRIRGPDFWRLTRKAPFVPFAAHGSIMFRRSVFDAVGGYRAECEYWEDQDLVVRMASVAEALVILTPLYQVRQWTRNSRAEADNERVENAVDLMYRSVARLAQGRSYEDLLVEAPRKRVDPRVFISSGSRLLWAGGKPRLFRRLLRRGDLRLDLRTIVALVWTAWAQLSPSSLRLFLSLIVRLKNWRARPMPQQGVVTWSPPRSKALASSNDAHGS